MPILHTLLLGFSGAVIAVWFKHHFVMLPDNQLSIGLPFLAAAALALPALFFCFRYWRNNPSFRFSWRPVFILPIVFCLSAVIFNTQAFFRGALFADGPLIPFVSWASANLSFATKIGSVFLTYVFLTIAFFAAGNLSLRIILHSPIENGNTQYGVALRIIAGMFAWSTFLLGIGMLGGLPGWIIWTAFCLILVWEHHSITTLFNQIFGVVASWQPHWKSAELYLFALGCFLVAFTLTQSIKPHPTGYDDMTYYMDRVQIMSERGEIISGGSPYPFELLAAAIRIASSDNTLLLAMSLDTYSLFFGVFILYGFAQSVFGHRASLLSAIILLSLPIGAALTIREVKPDPLLFAVSAMVLWSLLRSITERKASLWYCAIGLFSFAVSIKLTALFLIAPIAFTSLILVWSIFKKSGLDFYWQSVFITISIGLLPLLPWISYSLTTQTLSSINSFQSLVSSVSADEHLKLRNEVWNYTSRNACSNSGDAEDLSHFITDRKTLKGWIFIPWDVTMNLHSGYFATEIGFLFLSLLPLFFTVLRKKLKRPGNAWYQEPVILLTLFALGYFSLWIRFGNGIFWYAYPGLALLILLVAELGEQIQFSRILFTSFWVILIFGLVSNTLVQMKLRGERAQVLFAGNELPADQFLDQSIAGYGDVAAILNENPDIRVLLTSSQLWYGIKNNDRRAVMDPYLDTFNCLHRERDDALTLSRLRDFDIRYILYARGYNAELEHGTRPTFNAKIQVFTDFIGRNLRVVWGSPYYTVFEVPPASLRIGR